MSKTLKRILIACMALALIGVVIAGIYALTYKKPATNTNTNNVNTTNQVVNQNTNTTTNTNDGTTNTNEAVNTNANTNAPVTNTNASDDQASVLRLARIFAERYGTFSNRNNFENITTLEPFMTEAFQKSSAEYITAHQSDGIEADFYGITTTVASLAMTDYSAGKSASVRIAARRVETKGNQDPTVSTQYINISFQNVSGSWKVSAATWE